MDTPNQNDDNQRNRTVILHLKDKDDYHIKTIELIGAAAASWLNHQVGDTVMIARVADNLNQITE